MTSNNFPLKNKQFWIDEGILYYEFQSNESLSGILDAQQVALDLIKQQHIEHIPIIAIMTDSGGVDVNFSLSDLGKVVSSIGLINHLSAILVVGIDKSKQKTMMAVMNKVFFSDRIQLCESLEEAQVAARLSISSSLSVLEH